MADQRLQLIIDAKDRASKAFTNLEKKVGVTADQIRSIGTRMTAAGAAVAAGVGVMIKHASDLNESINAVNVVFGEGADNILEFGKTAAKNVGLAAGEFNQLATVTGALLADTGKPMTEVADITSELAVRAADMASVMNTDVQDALSALNQAIRGETEAIRRYTGDVTDASLESFRLSEGIGRSVTEMSEQEKRLLRVQLLMQQTAKFAGDFANTSEEAANKQRILSAQIKDLSANIGSQLRPLFLQILQAITPIIENISRWVQENPKLAGTIAKIVAVLGALMLVLGPILIILPGLIAVFTALTWPILAFIAAIAALIAIGIAVMANWDKIKAKATSVFTAISNFINKRFGSLVEFIRTSLGLMLDLFVFFKKPSVQAFKNLWDGVKDVTVAAFNLIKDTVRGMINLIINKINFFIKKANEISGKVPGVDIPNIPQIPKLAKGGIVTRPTLAVVGEDGPEAVIPLNKKNNPQGIGLGSGVTIIVQGDVTGEELIERVGDALTRRLQLSSATV